MGKETSAAGGIGFGGLLCLLFIALKLTHQIHWSWWWILSPLWVFWGGFAVFIVFCLVMAGLSALFASRPKR